MVLLWQSRVVPVRSARMPVSSQELFQWRLQVRSRELGSIAVLECAFLHSVAPLLGSCLLAFQTVLQGDGDGPLPLHHPSLCISFYFGVAVGCMHLSVPRCRLQLQSKTSGVFLQHFLPYYFKTRSFFNKKLPV